MIEAFVGHCVIPGNVNTTVRYNLELGLYGLETRFRVFSDCFIRNSITVLDVNCGLHDGGAHRLIKAVDITLNRPVSFCVFLSNAFRAGFSGVGIYYSKGISYHLDYMPRTAIWLAQARRDEIGKTSGWRYSQLDEYLPVRASATGDSIFPAGQGCLWV